MVKSGDPNVWDRAGGNVGDPCCLVPVLPAWWDCIGARLSGAVGLVLCLGSCRSLSNWTCKRATEDARVLVLSRIWSSWTDPIPGASCPASSAENPWPSSFSSSSYSALSSDPGYLSHWDPLCHRPRWVICPLLSYLNTPPGRWTFQLKGERYVPVPLYCSVQGILGSGQYQCVFLSDAGGYGSGTGQRRLHQQRVARAVWGDVHSETGSRDHLGCSANNQPFSGLVKSSAQGCAGTAYDYPMPWGSRRYLTKRSPLSAELQPISTSWGPCRRIPWGRSNGSPVWAGAARVPGGAGLQDQHRCR